MSLIMFTMELFWVFSNAASGPVACKKPVGVGVSPLSVDPFSLLLIVRYMASGACTKSLYGYVNGHSNTLPVRLVRAGQ